MVRNSGRSISDLKAVEMDGMPKSPSSENTADRRIVQRLFAEQVVKRTIEAFSHVSDRSKQVLSMLYIEEFTDGMCYRAIGYEKTQYFDKVKPHALLEFADAYLLDDLHIYKERQDSKKTGV
ncbi:ArpU family phage packaging/lysis transcriptional regulator [Secundilactobacillus oryzae]|nr:ArpU family phage packaging/lysis transcriptional regulator [Secundilactobacillus oryzae]